VPNPDVFQYIAPNADTLPRHKAIVSAWQICHRAIADTIKPFVCFQSLCIGAADKPKPADYAAVNDACKAFYEVIQKVCPPSADRSAAERCVRLARMKANETMYPMHESCTADLPGKLGEAALMELLSAKHQASASISLALPHELPALELP
jgi:hypothetical protein